MTSYTTNIEKETLNNDNFRKVLFTGTKMQLVAMSLKPKEEIGEEVHENVDQFFRVEKGSAKFIVENQEFIVNEDEVFIVTAGSKHNVVNIHETEVLKLYTIYAPSNHPEGTVHTTKAEADQAELDHHHEV
ncbi:cupin domain-containing protein [Candidatus Woesebacteria bacterium]|nr:MAG: cupin domain-containing protein [Candidatus Woesebacteria bacterium]